MSVAAKVLIPTMTSDFTITLPYTAPTTATIIDKFTATNTDSSTRTFNVYLVQAGGMAGLTTTIISALSIAAGATVDITALQNQILMKGDFIGISASVAGVVVVRASGREIT